jgi:hypothetical protein
MYPPRSKGRETLETDALSQGADMSDRPVALSVHDNILVRRRAKQRSDVRAERRDDSV